MFRSLATKAGARVANTAATRVAVRHISATSFKSAAAVVEAAAPVETVALTPSPEFHPTSVTDIINRYGGLYPLIGLGAVAAVSKELLVLNEELLMVTNFATVAVAGYVMFADTITTAFKEQVKAESEVYEEWGQLESDGLKAIIAAHKRNLHQADAVRYIKEQYNTLAVQAHKANNVQAQIAARDAVEKKLQEIHGRELSESNNVAKLISSGAVDAVKASFKRADASTKRQLIDNAILLLSGEIKAVPVEKDAVKQAFLQYFKSKQ